MNEKVVGILGGMGPEATLDLFQKIIKFTNASKDQDHLRVIIDSNPKIPDRTEAILGRGEDPVPMMVRSVLALERAGASFVVIPCVSAHFFLDQLRSQVDLPILSIFDETANYLIRNFPDLRTVGLLASTGTVRGGRFQKRLLESGIVVVMPEPDDRQKVVSIIYEIKRLNASQVYEKGKEVLVDVSRRLIQRGSQGIISGCTEVPLVLESKDLPVPVFDVVSILAGAAVRVARSGACS
jgi:aspartate racemase